MPDPGEEYVPWCSDRGDDHDWSEWKIGPYFPREERFCSQCGGMETQEIRPGPAPDHFDGSARAEAPAETGASLPPTAANGGT